jgi:predicted nucleotidyltransferase
MVVDVIPSQFSVREGDFIETKEGLIFDVKGLVHPPNRVIAFLRYYPSPKGKRKRDGINYAKVYHLAERFDILRTQHPQYLYEDPVFGRELQGISIENISRVYCPIESLEDLSNLERRDALQQDVVTFANIICESARLKLSDLGISGSVQVNLHGPSSDIDLIVYGRRAGRAVQLALRRSHLVPEQGISRYRLDTYRPVYNLRWSGTGIPIETMLLADGLKSMHGVFGGHHYFVRAVLDWGEVKEKYGDRMYHQLWQARVKCRITNDRDSLFTPCRYEIDEVEFLEGEKVQGLREIVSFRGRFAEQVKQDEEVIVRGMLERVGEGKKTWVRFILGDRPTDILIPSSLL